MEVPDRQTYTLASVFMLITLIGVMLGLVLPLQKIPTNDFDGWVAAACFVCGVPVGVALGAGHRRKVRGMFLGGVVGYLFAAVAFVVIMSPSRLMAVFAACTVLIIAAAVLRKRN